MKTNKTIFLYGPPASGKSTLAKALGEATGRKVFDTDTWIAKRAGRSIPEIFATEGEAYFRDLEASVLQDCIKVNRQNPGIVALGGGTLLRDENRKACEEAGIVFCLEAPSAEELAKRIASQAGSRPLGDKARERAPHYASFPNRIASFFMLPDSLIVVGTGIAEAFLYPERTVFDGNVASLYPELSRKALGVIPSGEVNKTPQTVMNLWHCFAEAGLGRRDLVMACGGGVTGDLTGFAAATWMRGIAWYNFPTTLLSMVDASSGGKTGCDLPEGKNLAGAFHSPKLVVIDTLFLKTLPEKELQVGKAEMFKHQIIDGRNTAISAIPTAKEIVENLAVKLAVVKEDPFETKGVRMKLNCGHTVGHAVELAMKYSLSHGEAVAIGCVEEARLACKLGYASKEWPGELADKFKAAGLPTELPDGLSFDGLKAIMRGDKKRQGNSVTFALPCGWGDVRLVVIDL
ncbi:MAG: bifunctional shikimate kinase/3-dehydroquinate synthase [Victivallales bacterium]|nr:bifunctional shikimate kinase/3-dehydroquinate synthase [Victivallales bacterium]